MEKDNVLINIDITSNDVDRNNSISPTIPLSPIRTLNNIDNDSTGSGEKNCRFCLESDTKSKLISPCLCSGTQKYIHRSCLNTWRYQDPDSENYKRCNECRTEFITKKKKSKIKTFFYNVMKDFNEYFLYGMTLNIGLNFLSGLTIDNILIATNTDPLTNYLYISGTILNVGIGVIYLLALIIHTYKNNTPDILTTQYKGIFLKHILFCYIFSSILFFLNWVVLIIINIISFRMLFCVLFKIHFKKWLTVHEEVLEYSEENLETISLIVT